MFGTHILHTVKPGDTVANLANQYQSNVDAIANANGLYPPFVDPYTIYVNQVLVIPKQMSTQTYTLYAIQSGDTVRSISQRFSTNPQLLVGINKTIHNPDFLFPNQQIEVPAVIYAVRPGDSLSSIADQTGIDLSVITQANARRPYVLSDALREGMRLIIPVPTSENIVVTQPFPGSVIRDNQTIKGYARVFEATVLYRVVDTTDVVVMEESYTTAEYGAPAYSRFSDQIRFDRQPTTDAGVLEVYTRSAMDGSIQDLVQIRVLFE